MKSVKSTPIEAGISTVLAGELLQLGPERVRQLIKDGYVVRSAHGRVTIRQAVQGYLRFRDDSERRSSKAGTVRPRDRLDVALAEMGRDDHADAGTAYARGRAIVARVKGKTGDDN